VQHNIKYMRTECAGCKIYWVHIIRLVPVPVIRPLFASFVLVPKNHSGFSTCGHYFRVPWQRPATNGNPANWDTLCFGTQLLSENRPLFTVATTRLLLTSPPIMYRYNLKPGHYLQFLCRIPVTILSPVNIYKFYVSTALPFRAEALSFNNEVD
jgi:hypothetical protein